MKNRLRFLLPLLTLTAAAFLLGFYAGRNANHQTVELTRVSTIPMHNAIPSTAPAGEQEQVQPQFPININTASAYELTALPGIGETIAQRIVAYRTLNGAFSTCGDLMHVEGIGAGKLEAILDLITTGG